jgi:hypothetical protein
MNTKDQKTFFISHKIGEMTLTQGMKELKLILKKITSNNMLINKYCAQPSNERPYFDDVKSQEKQVSSLIQSNEDLLVFARILKSSIDYTNIVTTVYVDKEEYTISEILSIKRTYGKYGESIYNSLNDSAAALAIRGNKDLTVVRYYSESIKNDRLMKYMDLKGRIDGVLELVNAQTLLTWPNM